MDLRKSASATCISQNPDQSDYVVVNMYRNPPLSCLQSDDDLQLLVSNCQPVVDEDRCERYCLSQSPPGDGGGMSSSASSQSLLGGRMGLLGFGSSDSELNLLGSDTRSDDHDLRVLRYCIDDADV